MAEGLSSATAAATASPSSRSTARQRTRGSAIAGACPPGFDQAATAGSVSRSRARRWLPAKPAAPVTRGMPTRYALRPPRPDPGPEGESETGARQDAFFSILLSGLLPAEGSEEIGERADAGEGERQVEAAILRHHEIRDAAEIVGLVLDIEPAALRVVEEHDPLLTEVGVAQIVIERVGPT